MRDGAWHGLGAEAPEFRGLFTRDAVLGSDWYRARLEAQQKRDGRYWEECADYLERFLSRPNYADLAAHLGIRDRLAATRAAAAAAREPAYLDRLVGTLGVDPAVLP
jgi:hypothetical protein